MTRKPPSNHVDDDIDWDALDELLTKAANDPDLAASFAEFEAQRTNDERRLAERSRRLEEIVEHLLAGRAVTGKQLVEIYDQAHKLLDAS